MLTKFYLLTIFIASSVFAENLTVNFSPNPSGYKGAVNFEYKMQNCFNDLHVAIRTIIPFSADSYTYKGKSYFPSDLGFSEFSNLKTIYVESLTASLYDGPNFVGDVTMNRVIPQAGFGCYGQSYSVKASIKGFNGAEAVKKIGNYSLRNPRAIISSPDLNLDGLIADLERKNKLELAAEEKSKAAAAAAGTVTTTTITTTSTTNSTQTKTNKPAVYKGAYNQETFNLEAYQKQVDQNIKNIEKNSQTFGEKSVQAAQHLGTAAFGLWEQGHGLGLGFLMLEEDNTFMLDISMGFWDQNWTGQGDAPSEFFAGGFVYMGVDLSNMRPTTGLKIGKGEDKYTRAVMGFNLLNNSWAMYSLRLVFGPTINLVDTYTNMGAKKDELKFEMGTDIGIAVAEGGAMLAITYNLKSELTGLHLIWKKN